MITRLSATPLLSTLVEHKAIANFPRATNVTADALQVICAWPLSGQYGPGSRLLYYAFVITSLLARKAKWLKTACFAATMLFPAVAAIHGIVLASVHIKGAVDLDIYGALETCAIGIIAAPVTIRLSPEYYYDLGRNTIFLWLCLVLAGLTSITVEFYRVTTSDCATDDFGNPVSTQAIKFPYGNATCGLNCSVDNGPWSSIRRGSTNNIYVIPSPAILTFGVATLCAAACCIPGILMLTGTWNRIFESNWRARFGTASGDLQPIEGTNGATLQGMKGVNVQIRKLMHVLAYPFFVLIALAILIIGEINFWSQPVRYQSEPMSSIGEWAPIVGTGVALLLGFVQGRLEDDESSPTPDTVHVHEVREYPPVPAESSVRRPPQRPPSPAISAIHGRTRPIASPNERGSLRSLPALSSRVSLEERPRRRHSF